MLILLLLKEISNNISVRFVNTLRGVSGCMRICVVITILLGTLKKNLIDQNDP